MSSRILPICRRRDTREAVAPNDMQHHQLGAGFRRDARCSAHQGFRLGAAGDRDDDALPRFPRVGDLVLFAVALQRRIDLVGQPQQRQFSQRGQIAPAEVVRQRGVDAVGRIHVAVGEPALQRFRRDVDQFDLVGRPHDLVGHPLLLLDAGDLGDDVVQAFQVLHVDRRDHGDAGVEQLLDVLPALRVLAAGGVGVGEFVDQHHLRLPGAAPPRRRVQRSACPGTRCSAAARPRCRRAVRRSSCGRGSPRPRRPRRCRAPAGGAPRRASRTSCRRRAPRPSRCAVRRASACRRADRSPDHHPTRVLLVELDIQLPAR